MSIMDQLMVKSNKDFDYDSFMNDAKILKSMMRNNLEDVFVEIVSIKLSLELAERLMIKDTVPTV
jgi:hypothetical protein